MKPCSPAALKTLIRRAYFCLLKQNFECKKFPAYIKETKKKLSANEIFYATFKPGLIEKNYRMSEFTKLRKIVLFALHVT